MKLVHTVTRLHFTVICGIIVAGCDKSPAITELKAQLATQQEQISLIKTEIEQLKRSAAILKGEHDNAPKSDSQNSLSSEHLASLNKAISLCVSRVRASAPSGQELFYKSFDAFYNQETGRVINNVQFQGGVPALFVFNKCMSDQGIPLK